MYVLPEWPVAAPKWTSENIALLKGSVSPTPSVTLAELLSRSEEFPVKFPIDSVRCKELKSSVPVEVLERNINSAYPLIHENALFLYAHFLQHKRKHGTAAERQLYKDMTVLDLIQRLLLKRAVVFVGRFDQYILVDGTTGCGEWELIGKDHSHLYRWLWKDAKSKLSLEQCLSYDEIKLSVFLSVSSYSYFLNDGTRRNMGEVAASRSNVQEEGIVIGLIGARLKRVGAMEYQEIVITKEQNTTSNGYGSSSQSLHSVFADFYEEPCLTYQHMQDIRKEEPHRFTDGGKDEVFDNTVYSKRIALSIDSLLLEANHRAKEKNNTAYIHVVGLGLGVWKCSPHQEEVFVETFAKRLKALGKNLSSVSDVYFSYFNQTKTCGGCKHGDLMAIDGHPKSGVKIHIGKRDPHVKLVGADKDKLLIVSYAWDGNAQPGNEFWDGMLRSSGDSAAAASTQISEIHNTHINPKVSVENLQVVTPTGHLSFEQYREKLQGGHGL